MDDAGAVRDLFDDWADRGRAEGMERGHGQTAGPLLASLPIGAGTRFLDLGCGNGWAARAAAARGATAVGVDLAPQMVARATAAARGAGLDARFEVADFSALPFESDAFDVVWSMEAIYYAADPDAVLREVRRVLAPGGQVHLLLDLYKENKPSHAWPAATGVAMVLRSEAAWLAALAAAGLRGPRAERRTASPGAGVEAWKAKDGTLHLAAFAAD